ncbi:MAG TPA: polyprenyl synthetase [Cytophagales bacterium]|nr:polyprenyl synthetase [Cytophagales bacterium]
MPLTIDQLKAPISHEMRIFEEKFEASMKSNVMLLDKIMHYIVRRKGKQIRPMFVFLVAKMLDKVNESTYRGASLIELLHTATLVHDDVVDEAAYRRDFFSINALWKNKISVLVGDFLLSKGLKLAVENDEFVLLKIVNEAVQLMSEGELLQMEKARSLDITEEVYFDIIRRKTASLISSCCQVGAASVSSDATMLQAAKLMGEKVGIAFQIKDDLFDYGEEEIGKPIGIDIREKKMTLPLIHSLNQVGWWEKKKMIYTIKNQTHKSKKVKEVIQFVKETGGLEYATNKMLAIKEEAIAILHTMPENECRTSLANLIHYTIERKN